MYNNMAVLYDDLMFDVDYEEWHEYIEKIFIEFNKRPDDILEMACGTGNLSYYLARSGYDLTCFDISSEMLSMAHSKLEGFNNAKLIEQDMIEFKINKKFDAIISVCDGINYILNQKDLLKVFENVKQHLDKDGIFIFDISSYYKLKHIIGDNTFIEDRGWIYYVWQSYFDNDSNIGEFNIDFFVSGKHNIYKRVDVRHLQKAYKISEIQNTLRKADFNNIYCFDNLSFNLPAKKSERITFVVTN